MDGGRYGRRLGHGAPARLTTVRAPPRPRPGDGGGNGNEQHTDDELYEGLEKWAAGRHVKTPHISYREAHENRRDEPGVVPDSVASGRGRDRDRDQIQAQADSRSAIVYRPFIYR